MKLYIKFLFILNLSLVICGILNEKDNIEICKDLVSFLNKYDYHIKENCCSEPGIKCDPLYGITDIELKFKPGKLDFISFPSLDFANNLKSLTIEGDVFQGKLPSVFFDMNLKVLKIINSNIYEIPENININNQLYEINLKQNKISKFPYQFKDLKSLEILNLNNNEITGSLTEEINNFEKLNNLSINDNNMTGELYVSNNINNMEVNDNKFDLIKLNSNDNKLISFYADNNNFNEKALYQLKKCPNLYRISLVNNNGISYHEYIEESEDLKFKDVIIVIILSAIYIKAFLCIKKFKDGNVTVNKKSNDYDTLPSYEEALKTQLQI